MGDTEKKTQNMIDKLRKSGRELGKRSPEFAIGEKAIELFKIHNEITLEILIDALQSDLDNIKGRNDLEAQLIMGKAEAAIIFLRPLQSD